MREPYQPIDCHFYDRLEELAVMRTACEVEFLGLEGQPEAVRTTIKDLFSADGEEFVELASGQRIRLDRLLSADGHALPRDEHSGSPVQACQVSSGDSAR